jgi:xylan 1,4-beta-xylosidase
MKTNIVNPILLGLNPDPFIVRVDDDYYIAASTFEWLLRFKIFTNYIIFLAKVI